MPTLDAFESPRLLIKGARNDVKQLDVKFRAWVKKRKPIFLNKPDPKTRERVGKLGFPYKVPGDFRLHAASALDRLRHALDQIVNCASVQLGGRDSNYFPFAKDATDFDRVFRDQCKAVPSGLHPLLKGLKPYPGGDDLLAILRISGKNKHRKILELDPNIAAASIDFFEGVMITPPVRIGFRWDSNKQELEFARIGKGGKIEGKLKGKMSLRVLLRDAPTPNSEPAAAVLYALASKVEGILLAVEAETARLLRSL